MGRISSLTKTISVEDHINPNVYDVKQFYSKRIDAYLRFSGAFRYAGALQAFFESCELLRPGLRVLDAGCGTGIATFALLNALDIRDFDYQVIHGFDLTPAMINRFSGKLETDHTANVHLCQADVLQLNNLPASWRDYDLIISASMLEYVPKEYFVNALIALRARLARDGCLVFFITRKNLAMKFFIQKLWKANLYNREELRKALAAAEFGDVTFRRFPNLYFLQNLWAYIIEAKHCNEKAVNFNSLQKEE